MLLARDWVEFRTDKKRSPIVRISPLKVSRDSPAAPTEMESRPNMTCHTLHLSEKTVIGKKVRFCADAPDVIVTFHYLRQERPVEMMWEGAEYTAPVVRSTTAAVGVPAEAVAQTVARVKGLSCVPRALD